MGYTRKIDFQLLLPVFILVLMSLTTLFSVGWDVFRNQLISCVISIGLYLFFSNIDFSSLESFSKPIYIVSFLGLLLLLLIGFEARGAARWIDIFGFRLQFSEVFKPFLAISLASFLANRKKSLATIGWLSLVTLPILFFIYKQPDLGSALMYLFSIVCHLLE